MDIKLVDASDIKKPLGERYYIKEHPGERCQIKKVPMEIIPKDMISCEEINCERTKLGMTDNCVICENINKDIFVRCKTKYK